MSKIKIFVILLVFLSGFLSGYSAATKHFLVSMFYFGCFVLNLYNLNGVIELDL